VLTPLSSTESQVEHDDGLRWDAICRDCGDEALFQLFAGSSSGRKGGLSARRDPASGSAGGSARQQSYDLTVFKIKWGNLTKDLQQGQPHVLATRSHCSARGALEPTNLELHAS
jgi:hypothetical protein